ncbi:MAG: hypothetical protein K8R36_15330 [Planctomycetales bacterium]|nr:hypothetical protein [Planctomycetales bacterium]
MKFVLCMVLGLVTLGLAGTALGADDPSGTWKWSVKRGDQTREVTLTLKLEGDKLTGHMPGRNNTVTPIEEASFKDGTVAFSVTREFNGVKRTTKYSGKLSGDTITGKSEGTDREGKATTNDWVAKKG